jgi:probable rRNA maturation factor
MSQFRIVNETKGSLPKGLPFRRIKESVLKDKYDLSLIFSDAKRMRSLNSTYRKKTYVPNVLAFPIEKNAGEIFINLTVAKKQAPLHGYSHKNFVVYLFIHAAVHLKGLDHGTRMEKLEEKFRKSFKILPL